MTWHLITRFPHHADMIRNLNETNPGFSALCDDYGQVVDSLRGRESAEDIPEVTELKKRRTALEEELLLTIESNRP